MPETTKTGATLAHQGLGSDNSKGILTFAENQR